jgi:choice-of-anchor C domain-containing protein
VIHRNRNSDQFGHLKEPTMRIFRITTVAVAVAGLLTAGKVQAAPFTNGGFDSGISPPPVNGIITLGAGNTNINGWTVTGAGIDWIDNGYWQASSPNFSIDLSGNNSGGIQQTFDTVTGGTYTVTFDLSGNPEGGPAVKSVSVQASGNPSAVYNYDIVANGTTLSNMKYLSQSYSFVATGSSTTLSFTSLNNDPYGPVIDSVNVSLTLTPPVDPVPAPAGLVLAALGMPALGVVARRRKTAA